jgi:hypothetical protein
VTPVLGIIGTRLAAAATVFGTLVGLQLLLPDLLPFLVGVTLIVLPFVQWAAVGFFAARSIEDPAILSLRARVQDATALALASTAAAVLGGIVVGRQFNVIPAVDRGVFVVGLAFVLLMTAAPSLNWLLTWRPWRSA